METIDDLRNVLESETELAETLLAILREQQHAIIHYEDDLLNAATAREEAMLIPFAELDAERTRIAGSFGSGEEASRISLADLARRIPEEAAEGLLACGKRLHFVVEQILSVNKQNMMLLDHSLRFIQQNLRIMTDDYKRNIVNTTV